MRHGAFSTVLAAIWLQGCATPTQTQARTIDAVGPLRVPGYAPASTSSAPPVLDAGSDALDDDEMARLAAELPAHLAQRLVAPSDGSGAPSTVRRAGDAQVKRCRLRAGAGRAATVYEAKCWVAWRVGEREMNVVEGSAVRRLPPRAISQDEAARIAKLTRNPLLSLDDSRAVLSAAVDACAAQLLAQRDSATQAQHTALRALARQRLARDADPTVALVDLARTGLPEDAALVVPHLSSSNARVRQRAAQTVGALCDARVRPALQPLLVDDDADVAAAARDADDALAACAALDDGG